ncbi:MAG: alanine racemase [Candidatus Aminicenantes bacterium]|nr:MAG: alanine racemase [Candidatus Aminicenantes bacterium]
MRKITRRDFLLASGLGSAYVLTEKEGVKKTPTDSPTKSGAALGYDPWIELSLDNMRWNLRQVKKLATVPIMAVIKANGYGHGLVEIGRFLEKQGIDYVMVGKIQEALLLREKGISCPILNFGRFGSKDSREIIIRNISQSVFDEEVKSLNQTALKLGKKAKVHIHVDTGMGRMGLSYRTALPYLRTVSSLKGISIEGISTTFTEDDDFDKEQLSRFLSLCKKAEKEGISLGLKHAASSDGILDLPSANLDMVRPGISIYGYYPSEKTQKENRLALRPVLQLKARVVAVKGLWPGDSLSYHRKYTAQKKEKIAIIPVGYSDGYPTNAVGRAHVLIRGKRYPLIAAITANHSAALLGGDSKVSVGDEIVLLGNQGKEKITAEDIAGWAEVSAYKILIGLNPLLPRTIV